MSYAEYRPYTNTTVNLFSRSFADDSVRTAVVLDAINRGAKPVGLLKVILIYFLQLTQGICL